MTRPYMTPEGEPICFSPAVVQGYPSLQ